MHCSSELWLSVPSYSLGQRVDLSDVSILVLNQACHVAHCCNMITASSSSQPSSLLLLWPFVHRARLLLRLRNIVSYFCTGKSDGTFSIDALRLWLFVLAVCWLWRMLTVSLTYVFSFYCSSDRERCHPSYVINMTVRWSLIAALFSVDVVI